MMIWDGEGIKIMPWPDEDLANAVEAPDLVEERTDDEMSPSQTWWPSSPRLRENTGVMDGPCHPSHYICVIH
jgi:hypothetical protein